MKQTYVVFGFAEKLAFLTSRGHVEEEATLSSFKWTCVGGDPLGSQTYAKAIANHLSTLKVFLSSSNSTTLLVGDEDI